MSAFTRCRVVPNLLVWPTLLCDTKRDLQADLQQSHLQKRWTNSDWDCHSAIFFCAPHTKVSHRGLEWHRVSKWWQKSSFLSEPFLFYISCVFDCILRKYHINFSWLFSPNASVLSSSVWDSGKVCNQKSHISLYEHSVSKNKLSIYNKRSVICFLRFAHEGCIYLINNTAKH